MSDFKISDPDFQQRVRDSFDRQNTMATLGVEIEGIEPGRVELIVPYRSDFAQQHGFMHAGIITTVLDTACGYAAFTLMPREAAVLTVELKTNLLSPGKGEKFSPLLFTLSPVMMVWWITYWIG